MSDIDPIVCVIDDDVSVREAIVGLVRSAGIEVRAYTSAQEYLSAERGLPVGCLVLDVKLPGVTGLELQELLGRDREQVPIVFVSGQSDVPMSVRALKAGALDFLTKPFDPDALLDAIRAGIAVASRAGVRAVRAGDASSLGIVGQSRALDAALAEVRIVASTDSTVLVYGETGTGKELVARAIHDLSERRQGPFVKVNCGAIPTGLLESELMGHEKGAFTGAIAQRIGRFELAHGGTLFLDEIGEIALELQPKLLRLLQEREFERVGGTRTVRSNVRVLAATNRDLQAMVRQRTFREDLYYRLNVFPITLPPLRTRRQDIPALVDHFVTQSAKRLKKEIPVVTANAMQHLQRYNWPGNVRELENVVERAMILARGPALEFPPLYNAALAEHDEEAGDDLAAVNKAHILGVLEATGWIVAGPHGAAARLGVKRSTLNYRMKKLGIPSVRHRARGFDAD
ncbi:MAG TPA: sigma-54 dependent transcriptional regulator [Polyangiaceae bacterium]|nr:sigma-54 dependent transcriptional regulator [Polyangiaceae bacterium]